MKEFKTTIKATGTTIDVCIASIKEIDSIFGEGSHLPLLTACGFAATFVAEEQISLMKQMYQGNGSAMAHINKSAPGHSVAIMQEFDDAMLDINTGALFLHEVGHCEAGHMEDAAKNGVKDHIKVGGCKMMINDKYEIEADAYAASFVGYHRLLAAINQAVKVQSALIAKHTGGDAAAAEAIEAATMAEVRASARYQELLKYTEGY